MKIKEIKQKAIYTNICKRIANNLVSINEVLDI